MADKKETKDEAITDLKDLGAAVKSEGKAETLDQAWFR